MNKKQKYKALIKQKFAWKLRHGISVSLPYVIPEKLHEIIKENFMEYQKEIVQVQVRTVGHLPVRIS